VDRYRCFADLAAGERVGVDYRVRVIDRGSAVAVVAPHGGAIEPGTSAIAAAIAGDDGSVYCFEGLRAGRAHGDLHVTSMRFDEPAACALVAGCETVVAVHGRMDGDDPAAVWVGGRDAGLRAAVAAGLAAAGFAALADGHRLMGLEAANICNRGRRGMGVQLELPRALRGRLVADAGLLAAFGGAVRRVVGGWKMR